MTGAIVSVAIRVCEASGPGVAQSRSVRTMVCLELEVGVVPVVGSAVSPVVLGVDWGVRKTIDDTDCSRGSRGNEERMDGVPNGERSVWYGVGGRRASRLMLHEPVPSSVDCCLELVNERVVTGVGLVTTKRGETRVSSESFEFVVAGWGCMGNSGSDSLVEEGDEVSVGDPVVREVWSRGVGFRNWGVSGRRARLGRDWRRRSIDWWRRTVCSRKRGSWSRRSTSAGMSRSSICVRRYSGVRPSLNRCSIWSAIVASHSSSVWVGRVGDVVCNESELDRSEVWFPFDVSVDEGAKEVESLVERGSFVEGVGDLFSWGREGSEA